MKFSILLILENRIALKADIRSEVENNGDQAKAIIGNSLEYAIFMSHIESKISSIVGNMIEYAMANHLNLTSSFRDLGVWKRQDPDFPDNIFVSDQLSEVPGI